MSTPSTSTKIAAVIASTRKKRSRIESAGGDAGSKIDRFWAEDDPFASKTSSVISSISCKSIELQLDRPSQAIGLINGPKKGNDAAAVVAGDERQADLR